MSDDLPDFPTGSGSTGGSAAGSTGNPAVDAVVRSLDRLEAIPVAEHVAVFEAAHGQLRAALAADGDADARR